MPSRFGPRHWFQSEPTATANVEQATDAIARNRLALVKQHTIHPQAPPPLHQRLKKAFTLEVPLLASHRVRLAGAPKLADSPFGVLIRDVTRRDDIFDVLGRFNIPRSRILGTFLRFVFGHLSFLVFKRMLAA